MCAALTTLLGSDVLSKDQTECALVGRIGNFPVNKSMPGKGGICCTDMEKQNFILIVEVRRSYLGKAENRLFVLVKGLARQLCRW